MWAPVSITLHYGITYNHLHNKVFYARHQGMDSTSPIKTKETCYRLTWLWLPLENLAIGGIKILRHPIIIQLS